MTKSYGNVLPPCSLSSYPYLSNLPTLFLVTTLNIHCHALLLLQSQRLPALLIAALPTSAPVPWCGPAKRLF